MQYHWKKLVVNSTKDRLPRLQDLGPYYFPLLPQFRVTSCVTSCITPCGTSCGTPSFIKHEYLHNDT